MTAILFLLLAGFSVCTAASEPNWAEIASRIDAYTTYPSPENARSAIAMLPDKQVTFSGSAEESKANEAIYARRPMAVLEKQVLRRDQASVELAFRLMNIADGAFAEDLDIIVGKLVKVDPVLFLTELQRTKRPDLEGLVLNLGDAYVDETESTCAEWRLRKKALQRVKVTGLEVIKQRVIETIDKESSHCTTR